MVKFILIPIWLIAIGVFVFALFESRPRKRTLIVQKPVWEQTTREVQESVPYVNAEGELAYRTVTKDVSVPVAKVVSEAREIEPAQREIIRWWAFVIASVFYLIYALSVFGLWLRDKITRRAIDQDTKDIELKLNAVVSFSVGIIAASLGLLMGEPDKNGFDATWQDRGGVVQPQDARGGFVPAPESSTHVPDDAGDEPATRETPPPLPTPNPAQDDPFGAE